MKEERRRQFWRNIILGLRGKTKEKAEAEVDIEALLEQVREKAGKKEWFETLTWNDKWDLGSWQDTWKVKG